MFKNLKKKTKKKFNWKKMSKIKEILAATILFLPFTPLYLQIYQKKLKFFLNTQVDLKEADQL